MKKMIVAMLLLLVCATTVMAQQQPVDKVKQKASQISKRLKLDTNASTSIYNAIKHIDTRIKDLAFGTPDYAKLLNYIDEERHQMMKAALPTDKYKEYKKLYAEREKNELKSLVTKNESFVKREQSKAERDERLEHSIMQRDMKKAEAEERKAALAMMANK